MVFMGTIEPDEVIPRRDVPGRLFNAFWSRTAPSSPGCT
jgi:hypothetical protein